MYSRVDWQLSAPLSAHQGIQTGLFCETVSVLDTHVLCTEIAAIGNVSCFLTFALESSKSLKPLPETVPPVPRSSELSGEGGLQGLT